VHFSDSVSDSNSDSDSSSDKRSNNKKDIPYSLVYTYLFDKTRIMEAPMHQMQNVARYSAKIIVEIVDSMNNIVPIHALLDTGTSETIILKSYLSSNTIRGYKGAPVKWKTLGGNFETHRQAQIQFAFPELSDKKYIMWVTHVDQHTNTNNAIKHYMI
jgi:hypothetical protein